MKSLHRSGNRIVHFGKLLFVDIGASRGGEDANASLLEL
jgi:hypothetical protein